LLLCSAGFTYIMRGILCASFGVWVLLLSLSTSCTADFTNLLSTTSDSLSSSSSSSFAPSYVFPPRWKASVRWWVKDAGTNMQKVNALAYMFTDYAASTQRVDQMYDIADLPGTFFAINSIACDHHLQTPTAHFYFYANGTTAACFPLPSGGAYPPQSIFNASTYVGIKSFEGIQCNTFNAEWTLAPNLVSPVILYQNADTLRPVALEMLGIPPYDMVGPNTLVFVEFKEVQSWPTNQNLFAVPTYCPSS